MRSWEKGTAEEFICTRANNHHVMSFKEQCEWIPKAQKGDKKAWAYVMACNQRLVMKKAHRFIGNGLDFADLIQEGNIGMVRAVQKWDKSKGFRFSTYAACWINQAIRRAISYKSRMVRLPVSLEGALVKVQTAYSESMINNFETLTTKELAEKTGIPFAKVERCMEYFRDWTSLDEPWSEDEDLTLGMLLQSDSCTEDVVEWSADREKVQGWLKKLSDKDRNFIMQRFGFGDGDEPKTRLQLARKYETIEEEIKQWEDRVMIKLKNIATKQSVNLLETEREEPDDPLAKKDKRKFKTRNSSSD